MSLGLQSELQHPLRKKKERKKKKKPITLALVIEKSRRDY